LAEPGGSTIVQVLPDQRKANTIAFDRALGRHGVTIQRVMIDNGSAATSDPPPAPASAARLNNLSGRPQLDKQHVSLCHGERIHYRDGIDEIDTRGGRHIDHEVVADARDGLVSSIE
jgi:hypothetical protein